MKAIILAGGSGTRLWPVSRYGMPKQFIKLNGGKSLLCQTVERLAAVVPLKDIFVITNEDYRFHVQADLRSVSPTIEDNVILEPVGRNTAPAIALVMRYCMEKLKCSKDEVIFICPSDHIIQPVEKFARYARQAEAAAKAGSIVTFGIKPSRPETGYGYIKKGAKTPGNGGVCKVAKFAEKPDAKTAAKYLLAGDYYWNSGMFSFTIATMLAEFKAYAPEISRKMPQTFSKMVADFKNMPSISIDYAVMEKSKKAALLPIDILWSDVGSWDSLHEVIAPDGDDNVKVGDVLALDTKRTVVMGEKRLISTIGLKDIIIIDTPDALLVAKRGQAQRVKEVVDMLKDRKRKEVVEHMTTYRPWGSYTILEEGSRYKIKRIVVKPGHKLSHQLHYHRSEHWIIVKGTAKVTLDKQTSLVHENESTYVPKSTEHRLENPGKVPLEMIEVQNGEYVGEDDIVRYDDKYGRANGK
ncbi:MAG: mannose-1-phosphate guanylyltransferase/mannose-6-phosphate isomerase [Elusimicrobia bacterium HGW-Elusimicrobia-3]|jgi:mannose-1-phosphate guanylyltransferase/mannose-6-phosphate isomerase|nr:MAG: mannose-1-phosphate guanylyltransferase/mannose-6-phosphate isomerase [Elusimicrobia bacterium HGW-Elusimicrobia-3]